jgi:FAD:protein FMN transferase
MMLAAAAIAATMSASLHADARELTRYEYTEYHMGVDVRIVVYTENRNKAEKAVAAAFERFAQLDTIMSDYRADSELMQLCAKAGGPPVKISPELTYVLAHAQELSRRSGGAFDVTCSPAVRLWRKARKTHVLPTDAEVKAAVNLCGWQKLEVNPRRHTARLAQKGMLLDLGGIGKGYANDEAQAVLKKYGVHCALVEAGGDIVVTDPPPGTPGWRIQAQIHNDHLPSLAPDDPNIMVLSNCSVSTSGDTEQFVDIGGTRYSHIVNPITGQALTNRIAVMVIAKNGITTDGLTKPVSILGIEKTQALVSTYPGAKVWIGYDKGDEKPTPRGDQRAP